MAQPKETLKALLLGKNLSTKERAETYVENISDMDAAKLIDLLMSAEKGSALNLEDDKGGFLTGLRKIVASITKDENLEVPEKPRGMDQNVKDKYIEDFDKKVKESNDEFAEGLRLILKSKASIRTSKLSSWKYELSDPDFPFMLAQNTNEKNDEYNAASEEIKKKLDKNQEELKNIMKKHKDDR